MLSRFPINTAFVEGWGLYSEKLGYDIGVYSDPLDRFGHLSEEIFRACRLVVDTGLHALGWSQDQALDFMLAHTAASEDSLASEITRYVTWPGQATAYKVSISILSPNPQNLIKNVQNFENHRKISKISQSAQCLMVFLVA